MELFHPDECGFAPSLPTGYGWSLPGRRKLVRYEYPRGRRVNVLATYNPFGPAPRPSAAAFERTLTSDDLLACLRALPAARVPRGVVPDDVGMHTSKAIKARRKELARMSHRCKAELRTSIGSGLVACSRKLDLKSVKELRPAA